MLKKFISNKKKSRLIAIIIITALISSILTYVSPASKIYRVKYTLNISENVYYQKLLISRELDINKLVTEVREEIQLLNNQSEKNFDNGCYKIWGKNTYDILKFSNSIVIEFETDINKLEEVNKCYNAIVILIEKLNKKIKSLTRFIYAEKIYFNRALEINDKTYNKFSDDLETFTKENIIRINAFYMPTKDFFQKENYFDKKINRFISYFIILFIFLLTLTYFNTIINKIKQFKL